MKKLYIRCRIELNISNKEFYNMCLLEVYDLLSENYKVVQMRMLDQARYFAVLNQNEKAHEVYEDIKNQILGISEEKVNKTRCDMYKRHSKRHGLKFPK